MNMTSNCDVTTTHIKKMTTIRHWFKPPHENFLRTPLSEAHKCARVGYIFYYEASQIQNINQMSGEALSIVSDLLPLTYWCWYRNDSFREASTTGIALIWFVKNFYCYCVIISMTHWLHSPIFLFLSCQSVFLYTILREVACDLSHFCNMAHWSKVVWL